MRFEPFTSAKNKPEDVTYVRLQKANDGDILIRLCDENGDKKDCPNIAYLKIGKNKIEGIVLMDDVNEDLVDTDDDSQIALL